MTELTRTVNLDTLLTSEEKERRIGKAREELLVKLFRQVADDDIAFRVNESREKDDYAIVVKLRAEAYRL